MRRFCLLSSSLLLVACAKTETPAADTAAAAAATAMAPPIALADVAGKWTVRVMNEGSDSVVAGYELTATADTTGWSLKFPNRPTVPVRVVAISGDSIVTETGPFESVLRKGVTVWVHTVNRLQNDMLVGASVAHYSVTGPDSVGRTRSEGTRAP